METSSKPSSISSPARAGSDTGKWSFEGLRVAAPAHRSTPSRFPGDGRDGDVRRYDSRRTRSESCATMLSLRDAACLLRSTSFVPDQKVLLRNDSEKAGPCNR